MKLKSLSIDRQRILDAVLIFLYAVLTLLLVLRHESWRDEAQPWLAVQKFGLFELFLKYLFGAGCPFLWYFLIFPLAKLGLPYQSILILNWIIAVAAASIFVIKAPFPRIFKFLFIFSYYMFFEYAVIARNYALTTLILFIVASLYKKRHESISIYCFFLFLLFNTHYFLFPLTSALFSLLIYETIKRKSFSRTSIVSLCFAFLGGLLAFLQGTILPSDFASSGFMQPPDIINIFNPLALSLFPVQWNVSKNMSIMIGLVLFVLLFIYLSRKKGVLYLYLVNHFFLFMLFTYFYPGDLRHFGLVLMITLFFLWVETYHPPSQSQFLHRLPYQLIRSSILLILVVSFICSFRASRTAGFWEWYGAFSGSQGAAESIEIVSKKFHLQDEVIVADHSDIASSVVAYLPNRKFWYADIQEFGTFFIPSKKYQLMKTLTQEDVIIRAGKRFQNLENLIFLFSKPLEFDRRFGYQFKLFYSTGGVWGYSFENYYLYLAVPEQNN